MKQYFFIYKEVQNNHKYWRYSSKIPENCTGDVLSPHTNDVAVPPEDIKTK